MLFTSLGRFRLVAFAEGVSAILLFLVAVPLKRIFEIPEPTLYMGWTHGGLFVLYMLLLIQVTIEKGWSFQKFALGTVASFVPFGTFYADARWFREKE